MSATLSLDDGLRSKPVWRGEAVTYVEGRENAAGLRSKAVWHGEAVTYVKG